MSALQKIRMSDGKIYGALNEKNRELRLEPYEKFLKTIIKSDSPSLLKNLTPSKYVTAVKAFFNGKVALDPCSNKWSIVEAETAFALPRRDGSLLSL